MNHTIAGKWCSYRVGKWSYTLKSHQLTDPHSSSLGKKGKNPQTLVISLFQPMKKTQYSGKWPLNTLPPPLLPSLHSPPPSVSGDFVFITFLMKYMQLSCLPRIKYFGLPMFVTWPVYRNVNDKKFSHGVDLKRIYISFVCSE